MKRRAFRGVRPSASADGDFSLIHIRLIAVIDRDRRDRWLQGETGEVFAAWDAPMRGRAVHILPSSSHNSTIRYEAPIRFNTDYSPAFEAKGSR